MGARIPAIVFFKSILLNHKITCDSVVKRHLRSCCPYFKRVERNFPVISPLSGVLEIIYNAVM